MYVRCSQKYDSVQRRSTVLAQAIVTACAYSAKQKWKMVMIGSIARSEYRRYFSWILGSSPLFACVSLLFRLRRATNVEGSKRHDMRYIRGWANFLAMTIHSTTSRARAYFLISPCVWEWLYYLTYSTTAVADKISQRNILMFLGYYLMGSWLLLKSYQIGIKHQKGHIDMFLGIYLGSRF